jgi:hypothetical protein
VKVLGIETSNYPPNAAEQWGITFPVAINGRGTAAAYGNASNTIVLVDKHGIVWDIATPPFAPPTGSTQVDSAVKSLAAKIPALLSAPVERAPITAHNAGNGSSGGKSKWSIDAKGRRIEIEPGAKAPQIVVDGVGSARTFLLWK